MSNGRRSIVGGGGSLGEGFTLPLEQAVTLLSSLELRLHYTQRLPGREDRLPILSLRMSTSIFIPPVLAEWERLTPAPDILTTCDQELVEIEGAAPKR